MTAQMHQMHPYWAPIHCCKFLSRESAQTNHIEIKSLLEEVRYGNEKEINTLHVTLCELASYFCGFKDHGQ